MIDWPNLFFNTLWILALAIGLAVFSYASWQASEQRTVLHRQLMQPGGQFFLLLAGLLFCTGLAGTSDRLWETALWGLLAVFFLWRLISLGLRGKRS